MFAPTERGRPFGLIGTVVGVGTALGPVLGGLLIALGGPDVGWRLVFFVNVPIGLACLVLARRWLPGPPPRETARRRPLDVPGALLLGLAVFCVLFAAVQYDALRDPRLAWLVVPALGFGALFVRREQRLTRLARDPLFDLRLFTLPTYTTGVVLALFFFTAHTGIPLVLALYYQDGLGYSALQSGLGVTALAAGSALSAATAGRLVDRWGRPLVLGALGLFWVGVAAVAAVALTGPGAHVALLLAVPLLVLGAGSGGVITPNQALSLRDVDSRTGSTAGGVLQTSQRMGAALGQALIGATFFLALPRAALDGGGGDTGGLHGAARDAAYGDALATAATVSLAFVTLAFVVGVVDLRLTRRRRRRRTVASRPDHAPPEPTGPAPPPEEGAP
jgi:MFS family permease